MGNTTYAGLPWPDPSAFLGQANLHIRSLAEALDQRWSGAALVRRANMAVANNTPTVFAWSGAVNAPNVGGSVPGTTDGITAGAAGIYLAHMVAHWDPNATGARTMQLLLNGAGIADDQPDVKASAGASTKVINEITRAFRLAAGDKINGTVTQTSGASLNVSFARFHMYRIA